MSAPSATLPGVVRPFADLLAATAGVWLQTSAPLPPSFTGVSIDTRTLLPGELFVAIVGERFDGHDFLVEARAAGASAALVSRAATAPAELPLVHVPDTTRALADVARQVRTRARVPVVAITGSVGKTTTKELCAGLLAGRGPLLKTEGNLNNQFGLPLTLLRLGAEHRTAVLELGMNHAGELALLTRIALPDVAVITRVAPVHLEFFASLAAIAAAKAEILEGLGPDGVAVLNGDDELLAPLAAGRAGRSVLFGRDRRFEVSAENWRGTAHGMRFDLRIAGRQVDVALPLPGAHNVSNFLAAAAAAHALGLSPDEIAERASSLHPAPQRGELLRLQQGLLLLDDSYNSNPAAVEAAVQALGLCGGRRRVAFLGDMRELGPDGPALHREVGLSLAGRLDVLGAVGALGAELLAGARAAGLDERSLHLWPDAQAAARTAPDLLQPGDAVLVKGSRGVRMEQIVAALVARFGPEAA